MTTGPGAAGDAGKARRRLRRGPTGKARRRLRRGPTGKTWRRMPLLALACLALALPPARAAAQETPRELVVGITQFPATFNPLIDSMLAKSWILAMTRRPVTTFDPDWRLVCMLCTELPSFENGRAEIEPLPDGGEGVALAVTLRPDLAWGDGVPVTAADVVFTWQVGRHPQSGVGDGEGFRRIRSIDVIDDRNFVLHVDRVTFDYNSLNGFDLLPAHLEAEAFADPAAYRNRTTFDRDPANPGLYFGPYRIVEVAVGSHAVLEPNPTWRGREPWFRRIVVRVIGNTAALEANLRSGAIDYIAGELGLSIDQALALQRRQPDDWNWVFRAGLVYEHLDVNLDDPVLADPRVRRALLHAVDREAINRHLFGGRQPVAHSSVSPLDPMSDASVPVYEYDPARAAALLDAAGWTEWQDGWRHDAAGQRLRVSLMTTAGNRSRELVQQVLQSQWREAGIETVIRNEPARVFFGRTVTRREFPGLAMFAWISSPENVPRSTLHSEMIPTAENNWAGQNYTGFADPEMDDLIDRVERELDPDRRRELWARIQRIYAERLPVLPLFFQANAYILPHWLRGVRPTGHQYPSTLWVEEWYAAP